jgi:hypothetical protein
LTLFLLTSLREQIKTDPNRQQPGLRHVTVIEEAHAIVGKSGEAKASEVVSDPKAYAAEYVSRMLAEVRALGEGIVIADQLPSAVAPEAVKNTSTKLVHRLVSNEDRSDIGGSMLFRDMEYEEVARLSPGEAYYYTEGMYRPRLIRGLNPQEFLQYGSPPLRASLLPYLEKDRWHRKNRENRAWDAVWVVQDYLKSMMDYMAEKRQLLLPGNLVPDEIDFALALEDPEDRRRRLLSISGKIQGASDAVLAVVIQEYYHKKIRRLQPVIADGCRFNRVIKTEAERIEKTYNETVHPCYTSLQNDLDRALARVKQLLKEGLP